MPKQKPHSLSIFSVMLTLACLLLNGIQSNTASAPQQQSAATVAQSERERGVVLFKGGDTKGAIKAFREAIKKNNLKNARKAFETAIKLRPDFAPSHTGLAYTLLYSVVKEARKNLSEAAREATRALALDARDADAHYVLGVVQFRQEAYQQALDEAETTLRLKADFAAAFLLKSQALLGIYNEHVSAPSLLSVDVRPVNEERKRQERTSMLKKESVLLKLAAESLEQFLKLTPSAADAAALREQLESLRVHAQDAEKDRTDAARAVLSAREVTEKARIIFKPEAQYTQAARQAQLTGTVILRAVLASDGAVKYILVLHPLPYGLTEAAINAARKIKFTPAAKDGRPVSQLIQIEYSFNLY